MTKYIDYVSGQHVKMCLGTNPNHTESLWVRGVIVGKSKLVPSEWDVDVGGKTYQTHWANLQSLDSTA